MALKGGSTFIIHSHEENTVYLLPLKFFLVVLSELFFSVPPKIIKVSQNQTVREGSGLQLFCEASGKPAPNITWTIVFRNGSESEVLHRGSNWNMTNIERTNQGTYRCTAYNGAGNADSFVVIINITCMKMHSIMSAPYFIA